MRKLSNVDICYWLTDWCTEAGLSPAKVTFKVHPKKPIIYIFTSRPGYLIGKAGYLIDKYKKYLKTYAKKYRISKKYKIELVEVVESDYWVAYEPENYGY